MLLLNQHEEEQKEILEEKGEPRPGTMVSHTTLAWVVRQSKLSCTEVTGSGRTAEALCIDSATSRIQLELPPGQMTHEGDS